MSHECLNQKRQLAVAFLRSTERAWEASERELSVERKASWSPPRKKRKKKCQYNQDDKKAVHILFCLISPVPFTLVTSLINSSRLNLFTLKDGPSVELSGAVLA